MAPNGGSRGDCGQEIKIRNETDGDGEPSRYPDPRLTAREFEEFVTAEFTQVSPFVDALTVTHRETIHAADGAYEFDATVRYRLGGLEFLVVVEAKRHAHPIKRDVVQVLHSKIQSVGAHKGVVVSTAPFQRGALDFASAHGIALVRATEGRFTFEMRGDSRPPPSRREAAVYGIPPIVGHCYSAGTQPGSVSVTLTTGQPRYAAELLLGADISIP